MLKDFKGHSIEIGDNVVWQAYSSHYPQWGRVESIDGNKVGIKPYHENRTEFSKSKVYVQAVRVVALKDKE